MKQTIEIEVPDGKIAVWVDGQLVLEDDLNYRCKTWEEYAQDKLRGFWYICGDNSVQQTSIGAFVATQRQITEIAKTFPFRHEGQARQHLALMKLHQLRDHYRHTEHYYPTVDEDWKKKTKFRVCRKAGDYGVFDYTGKGGFLTFGTREVAEEFLNNFRDLIEQAGDLI